MGHKIISNSVVKKQNRQGRRALNKRKNTIQNNASKVQQLKEKTERKCNYRKREKQIQSTICQTQSHKLNEHQRKLKQKCVRKNRKSNLRLMQQQIEEQRLITQLLNKKEEQQLQQEEERLQQEPKYDYSLMLAENLQTSSLCLLNEQKLLFNL